MHSDTAKTPQDLQRAIKTGEVDINSLLVQERHIADFDVEDLAIDIIPSGFPSLDEFGFIKEGRCELIIVGGRPSSGKSAFMFQTAYNVSHTMTVHVFSLEMDNNQIQSRLMTHEINRSLSQIQKRQVAKGLLEQGKERLQGLKYYVDDTAGLTVQEVCSRAIEAQRRINTGIVIIDYLQLMRVQKSHSKDDEIGIITSHLKSLAKTMKVPVMVGCQLNRACEVRGKEIERMSHGKDRSGYKPILSDLRDSGNIEQDADIVVFVHRQSMYSGDCQGRADIIVAKNRNGPVGEVKMDFTAQQCRFIDKGDSL